jgi:hypothetical protein
MNCRQVTREAAVSDFLPKAARCLAEWKVPCGYFLATYWPTRRESPEQPKLLSDMSDSIYVRDLPTFTHGMDGIKPILAISQVK